MKTIKMIGKRFLLWIGAAILLTAFGCRKSQHATGNSRRGDAQLEAMILDAGEADVPAALPTQGECVKESFSHKTLPIHVNVDAAVQVALGADASVYQVQPYAFTDADANRIAAALTDVQSVQELVPSKDNPHGWVLSDGTQSLLVGDNGATYYRTDVPAALLKDASPRYSRSMTILPELSIGGLAYADAAAKADTVVGTVTEGIGAYALREAYAVQYDNRQWYEFEYTRTQNRIPIALLHQAIANDTGEYETWEYERLRVVIDPSGLLMLRWNGAMALTKTVSEQPALLPFVSVMDCFRTMALVVNSGYEDVAQSVRTLDADGSPAVGLNDEGAEVVARVSSVTINITKVELVYARVQSGSDYYLIPAWRFSGTDTVLDENGAPFYEDGEALDRPFLTINAIDGSIINSQKGY